MPARVVCRLVSKIVIYGTLAAYGRTRRLQRAGCCSLRSPGLKESQPFRVKPPFRKSNGSALAHYKPPSARKDNFSFAKKRKKNAFRVPAKGGLPFATPVFARRAEVLAEHRRNNLNFMGLWCKKFPLVT